MQAAPLVYDPLHPLAYLRARVQRFWLNRHTLRDSTELTQRNVYILPTRAGLMLGVTLMVLLVSSINYQLNLGYVLTFLLMGCAVVGMHVSHSTLRGLAMHLSPPEPVFAGDNVSLAIHLASKRRSTRYGVGLAVLDTAHWSWTDVPAQGNSTVHIAFKAQKRGLHHLPALTAQTLYPLGTFRVWTVWRPAAQVLVYPRPEAHPPPLPPCQAATGGAVSTQPNSTGEFDGVRAYRRGDPLKLVVWKKAAKADELVSRDAQQAHRSQLWLDIAHSAGAKGLEHQLERLCAWVLLAEKQGLNYGLRLSGCEIAPSSGEAHKRACLQALALS